MEMLQESAAAFGTVTAGILTIYGLYATAKTKFLPFRSGKAMIRQMKSPPKTGSHISPLQSFATSLAGTVGVGNLTGVSLAIALGGPGAVFWIWVSAFVCMTVKYFEVYLAVKHQPKEEIKYGFGPMEYLKKATDSKGFAVVFALCGVFASLAMGSGVQTSAAAEGVKQAFGIPLWGMGILFSAGVGIFFALGGKIGKTMEKVLPLLGGVFLLMGTVVILFRWNRILPAICSIFTHAFDLSSLTGGVLGSGAVLAFRHGVGNGLFSHEAGLGSGGLAHGACGADPETQGLWGAFEVFADSIVISTLSALMILTTGVAGDTGGVLSASYEVLGGFGKGLTALCLVMFAFLSVLSWSLYGETCFVWICGKKAAPVFRILYALSPLAVIFAPEDKLWQVAEILNGMMLILNITGLLGYGKELKRLGRVRLE